MGLTIIAVGLGSVVIAAIFLVVLSTRNDLVRQRNELGKALLDLDQLLKERRDELPKLLGTCRSYLGDSSSLFESITAARAAGQKAMRPPDKARAADDLAQALRKLFGAADRDAALALDASYRQIKKSIVGLDEKISAEQARFNQQAAAFNTRLRRVPGSLAASMAGVRPQALFRSEDAAGK
ncbi:MAG TPA: LemA family protein [Terriglobia bacterium]|nr:LemA family protein [Terriglobia bacterium]